jgi:hypothetical protein
MYRHAYLEEGVDILDVGTGSGYGCALSPPGTAPSTSPASTSTPT